MCQRWMFCGLVGGVTGEVLLTSATSSALPAPEGGGWLFQSISKNVEDPLWFTAYGKQRSGVDSPSIGLQILLVWPARMTANDGSGPVSEASLASRLSHEDFPRAATITAYHTGD